MFLMSKLYLSYTKELGQEILCQISMYTAISLGTPGCLGQDFVCFFSPFIIHVTVERGFLTLKWPFLGLPAVLT